MTFSYTLQIMVVGYGHFVLSLIRPSIINEETKIRNEETKE